MAQNDSARFYSFKECLARRILSLPTFKPDIKSPAAGDGGGDDDDEGLDDFTLYLASEVWLVFPPSLRDASYETRDSVPDPSTVVTELDVPASFTDTLVSYGISSDVDGVHAFLRATLGDYVFEACAPPPIWKSTRTEECEICERKIPLTYHHLIPRSTHDKVLKKGWHAKSMINAVAWLCR
jgi:hypothetical protein